MMDDKDHADAGILRPMKGFVVLVFFCVSIFYKECALMSASIDSAIVPSQSPSSADEAELQALRLKVKELERKLLHAQGRMLAAPLNDTFADASSPSSDDTEKTELREVQVNSMCRCSSNNLPVPHNKPTETPLTDTGILQKASLATGPVDKTFLMNERDCECRQGEGTSSADATLSQIETKYCGLRDPAKYDTPMKWDRMPDFGVQELPLFAGVLSYKSPRSLGRTLKQWTRTGFTPANTGLAGAFLQLNARSEADDRVVSNQHSNWPFVVTGSPEENLHPGRAIARFCRAAEQSPQSHPNGENLLLFLEKDWHLAQETNATEFGEILRAAKALTQRGVNYVRLTQSLVQPPEDNEASSWQCEAEGIKFRCTPAHQHRYTNLPAVIRCDWFLRYLEPFALMEDTVMHSCNDKLRERQYFDWEEAMQDGRIAWTDAQWVVASYQGRGNRLFDHREVDQ